MLARFVELDCGTWTKGRTGIMQRAVGMRLGGFVECWVSGCWM